MAGTVFRMLLGSMTWIRLSHGSRISHCSGWVVGDISLVIHGWLSRFSFESEVDLDEGTSIFSYEDHLPVDILL